MSVRPWIWAPDAGEVLIRLRDDDLHCARGGDHGGRWHAPVELEVGTHYRFVVDGHELPDPRSRCQPEGVHGPTLAEPSTTRAVEAVEVSLDRAVVYELHIGTFSASGTFLGAIGHLDHLVDLGITHVEVMPVAAFDGRWGWGYDGVDLFAPHPAYGTTAELAELVDACHARGLAVLLDVVYNHLGPSGNYLGSAGPYFTDRYTTPWGDAVNLDGPGSDEVRAHLIDNALHWLGEVGLDGLRLDAVHALFDTSATQFLEELAAQVRALGAETGRRFVLVAESDRNDPRILSEPPTGPGLDGVWCDDLHHCLHVTLTREQQGYYEDYGPSLLPIALADAVVYQGRWSPHRRRTVGRPYDGHDLSGRVVSLQNHDQVGNRAGGERLHHLVGAHRAAAAAALTILSPFPVLVFQGEEWAASSPFPYFSDHAGDLGDAVRSGRRREFAAFGWSEDAVADPQDPATFDSARLRWDEIDEPDHRAVHEWYRSLVELRRTHPALDPAVTDQVVECEVADGLVRVRRGTLTVLANLAPEPRKIAPERGRLLLRRGDDEATPIGSGAVTLGPGSVLVLDTARADPTRGRT